MSRDEEGAALMTEEAPKRPQNVAVTAALPQRTASKLVLPLAHLRPKRARDGGVRGKRGGVTWSTLSWLVANGGGTYLIVLVDQLPRPTGELLHPVPLRRNLALQVLPRFRLGSGGGVGTGGDKLGG